VTTAVSAVEAAGPTLTIKLGAAVPAAAVLVTTSLNL